MRSVIFRKLPGVDVTDVLRVQVAAGPQLFRRLRGIKAFLGQPRRTQHNLACRHAVMNDIVHLRRHHAQINQWQWQTSLAAQPRLFFDRRLHVSFVKMSDSHHRTGFDILQPVTTSMPRLSALSASVSDIAEPPISTSSPSGQRTPTRWLSNICMIDGTQCE